MLQTSPEASAVPHPQSIRKIRALACLFELRKWLWLSREGVLGQRREGGKVVPSAVGAGLTTIKGTVRVCGSQSAALGIGQGLLEMPWAQ